MLYYILSDPFTIIILKSNIFPTKNERIRRKSSITWKKIEKEVGGNLSTYFQASLSLEIIYTILNAVSQQFVLDSKTVVLHKKKDAIKKIHKRAQSINRASIGYQKIDNYDEKIFRMNNQILKNLDQLENSDVLLTEKENDDGILNLNRHVIVKQYAPKTFQSIRKLSGITDEAMIESLDPSLNIKQIQNAGEGAGASGSFFFFTKDRNFILKTMSMKEIEHLLRVLPEYYEHLDTIKDSVLAKVFGIFTIRIDKFEPIHVMIMQNSLPKIQNAEINYLFDMKGSSINREVLKSKSVAELKKEGPTGSKVLKDLDFIRLKQLKNFMKLEPARIHQILNSIQLDLNFLKSARFMDYSLLLAVSKV